LWFKEFIKSQIVLIYQRRIPTRVRYIKSLIDLRNQREKGIFLLLISQKGFSRYRCKGFRFRRLIKGRRFKNRRWWNLKNLKNRIKTWYWRTDCYKRTCPYSKEITKSLKMKLNPSYSTMIRFPLKKTL